MGMGDIEYQYLLLFSNFYLQELEARAGEQAAMIVASKAGA